MRKTLFLILLTGPMMALAQSTAVTGTVTDTGSQIWANASYRITFTPQPGTPVNSYTWQGSPIPQAMLQLTGFLDSSGSFSVSLPDTTVIIPATAKWTFTICPLASTGNCQTIKMPISGTSEDVSTQLSTGLAPPSIYPTGVAYAYQDSNAVATPGIGQLYFNSSSLTLREWNGSAWTNIGGGGGSPGGSNLQVQFNNAGSFGGASQATYNTSTNILSAQLNATNQIIQNRSDVYDVIADGGAKGAGNTATCDWNTQTYSGCHDDSSVLSSILSNTSLEKYTIFLPRTATTSGYCDYYSSTPLTSVSDIRIRGVFGQMLGNNVSICFPTQTVGLTIGAHNHISDLTIVGADPWVSTNIATYVLSIRDGGAGANADGLIVAGESTVENVSVMNFARDCIAVNSTITGGSDAVSLKDVYTTGCRGNGIAHIGSDSQAGNIINAFSRFNQLYNIYENNANAIYGNTYEGGNTSDGHQSQYLSTGSYVGLSGAISGVSCVANTTTASSDLCTVTMTASNTLHTNSYLFNPFDTSANDIVSIAGTGTALDGNVFYITASTSGGFSFNYSAALTAGAGGTAAYNPGQRIWALAGAFGGGWGVHEGSSHFIRPYSELTDAFNEFTNVTEFTNQVDDPFPGILPIHGGSNRQVAQGFVVNTTPQFIESFLHPQIGAEFGGAMGLVNITSEPTVFDAGNYNAQGFPTVPFSEFILSRSTVGNNAGWWYEGQEGTNNSTTMSAASVAYPDALTTTGRSSINNTTWPAWFPSGEFRGNSLATGNPDCFYGTGSTAPTAGSWQVCDFIYNTGVTSTGTLGWVNTTAGTPGTWTAVSVTGNGTGPGTTGELGVYSSTGEVIGDTLTGHSGSILVNTDTNGFSSPILTATGTSFDPGLVVSSYPNDTSTGTTAAFLAKINSSGNAIKTTTSDSAAALVFVEDATHSNPICAPGTSGNACLITSGFATCTFDASGASFGNMVGVSTTTAGACHAIGSTVSGLTCIGEVVSASVAANATGVISVGPCVITSGGVSPSVAVGTVTSIAPLATPTVTNTGSSTAVVLAFGIPANTLQSAPPPFRFLGDGNEGALNLSSGGTVINGEHWYSSITIASGASLQTTIITPLVLRSTGACNIAGTIEASINSGGVGLSTSSGAGGGSSGGGGGGTGAGAVGVSQVLSGAVTAAAGTAGAASGGNGGNGATPSRQYLNLIYGGSVPWSTPIVTLPNTLGGSAGGNGGTGAAAGGKGGQAVFIICGGTLTFTGTIDASGQNGTNSAANNNGGGGGGGGGIIGMAAGAYGTNTGTMNVAGGSGGTCGAFTGCGTGGNGASGTAVQFTIQ